MPHRLLAVPAAAVTVLLLAACGSASSSSSASASSSSQSAAAAQPAASSSSAAAGAGAYGAGAYGAGGYGAASSQSASTTASASPTITTKHDAKLGTILAVGSKQLTVYMFEADKGAASACSGACASVWPPVTGTAHAAGGAASADLGTIKRADGTVQVTYKGHPLYRYARDGDAGDAYGAGIKSFGAPWYALAASGKVIDNS